MGSIVRQSGGGGKKKRYLICEWILPILGPFHVDFMIQGREATTLERCDDKCLRR